MSLLFATAITKSYGAIPALKGVSFDLRPGEVHALVGENGAGKSTLIRIFTGATQADSGHLEMAGERIRAHNTSHARALGFAAIYQQPALFPDLSVAENLALGSETSNLWRRVNWRARHRRAKELLARVGASIDPGATVDRLSMPEQQLVEIARALGAEARVLIMDEPTASLSEKEVENLVRIVRDLKTAGKGIVYISHRLDELFQLADRVTVLRDGSAIETRYMSDIDKTALIRLMVGRDLSAVFPKREICLGETALEIRDLGCLASGVHHVNLSLRAGEIFGLAGLIGCGRSELARILFGLTPADSGKILVRGQTVQIAKPEQAIALGIAYVPEDRRKHGVIPEMTITTNTSLAVLRSLSRFGFLNLPAEAAVAADLSGRLSIKAASLSAPVATLSGGNQQKVALGRWLAVKPSILILDEPTQGVDVGAKAEIHRIMGDLAEQGMAILMISSELPEILGMSDRVAVMRQGTVAAVLSRAEAEPQHVLSLALGHSVESE